MDIVTSIAELTFSIANAIKEAKDLEADGVGLGKLVRAIGRVVEDAALDLEGGRIQRPGAQAALQDLKESLDRCLGLVKRLSSKGAIVKFFRAGDYLAQIKAAGAELATQLGLLQVALSLEGNTDIKRGFESLQSELKNLRLDVLRAREEKASRLRLRVEQFLVAAKKHGGRMRADVQADVRRAVLDGLAEAGMLPQEGGGGAAAAGGSAGAAAEQEVQGAIVALQDEMAELRQAKEAAEEQYLSQLVHVLAAPSPAQQQQQQQQQQPMQLPPSFFCPITLRVMRDPVMLVETGHSFEREAIERHLSTSNRNPVTNVELSSAFLTPNYGLRGVIVETLQRAGVSYAQADDLQQMSCSDGGAASSSHSVSGLSVQSSLAQAQDYGTWLQTGRTSSGLLSPTAAGCSPGSLPSASGASASQDATVAWTLGRAAKKGNLEALERLLASKGDIEEQDKDGGTPLFSAAKAGQADACALLIRRGANLEATNKDGLTPLHIATFRGHVAAMRVLLLRGANTEATEMDGWTPLHIACFQGSADAARELLARRANVDATTKDGYTPFQLAAFQGHGEAIQQVLQLPHDKLAAGSGRFSDVSGDEEDADADARHPNAKHRCAGEPMLPAALAAPPREATWSVSWAAEKGFPELIRRLADKGAKLEEPNEVGDTPLCVAARHGRVEAIRELLARGANVNRPNKSGAVPLLLATQAGRTEAVRMLLDKGARADRADAEGTTPLHAAASRGDSTLIRELLDKGGRVEAQDKFGATPLFAAVRNNRIEAVKELMARKANPNATDKSGATALHCAVSLGHVAATKLLLEKGARTDRGDAQEGFTPLHVAASFGYANVARELLAKGAKTDARDKFGATPLLLAARSGHVELVCLLLAHGANTEHATKDRQTPLLAAAREGQTEVVKELLAHGAKPGAANKDGNTPLHAAVTFAHVEVVQILRQHGASVEVKNNKGQTARDVAWKGSGVEQLLA